MIKGVNKQIIEVSQTGNRYYEKAWLVVSSQYSETDRDTLESEAQNLVSTMGIPSAYKASKARRHLLLRMGLSAFVGSGVTILIQALLK